MKRTARLFLAALAAAFAGKLMAASILNSSHDMSVASLTTGPKASSEQEVCIFCHTPHKPNPNVPLWNKVQTEETFTFYSSNYVNAHLGLAAPTMADLPGTRTRFCLSCHDGLTALGGVYNLHGTPGTIDVSGSMAADKVLGTSLADDHPVLYSMDQAVAADPEMQMPAPGDAVKLYGSDNRVECTSCHNPHNNEFGDFLAKDNASAAICITCHAKTGYAASAHAQSGVAYTPPGGSLTTVGEWSCRCCHTVHSAAGTGAYLLADVEEGVCYGCHSLAGLVGAKDLETPFGGTSRHPIATSGVHINPETDASNFGNATRHAECADCHQSHQAQVGNRLSKPAPDNLAVNVLLGAWGVEPTYGGGAWLPPISYTERTFADTSSYKEPWLCFKCHSSYAYGGVPPVGYTDPSIELNTANYSFHPVLGPGDNPYCTQTAANGNNITMEAPWNDDPGEHNTMMCSDCHGPDPGDGWAEGPHGSNSGIYILQESLIAREDYGKNQWATPLCLKCHRASVYVTASQPETVGSRFDEHGAGRSSHMTAPMGNGGEGYGGCLACHGNFLDDPANPDDNVRGTFHGSNYIWPQTMGMTAAFPAINFLNNRTNMNGWEQVGAGGYCWNDGACRANHGATY